MNKNGFDLKALAKTCLNGFVTFLKKGGWFCFLMFFIDLVTKLGMNSYFGSPTNMLHEEVDIIPGVLYLTLVYNTGAAYGAGSNMGPGMRITFACLSFVVAIGIIVAMIKYFDKMNGWLRYSVYLILAGDLGNFIDRACYWDNNGIYGVVDWIGVGNSSWPSFLTYVCNWADICLTVGAVIFVISYIVFWNNENKKSKEAYETPKKDEKQEIGSSYAMAEKMMNEEIEQEGSANKTSKDNKVKEDKFGLDDIVTVKTEDPTDKNEDKSKEESKKDKDADSSLSDLLKGE